MSLTDIIPHLQLAIGPVILISGVGLILLSMTNRFSQVINRSRILAQELRQHTSGSDRVRILEQLRILSRRAKLIRTGIAFGAFSALLAALLIITLFVGTLLQIRIAPVIVCFFVLCMICLIVCLLLFISDMNFSLKALWLEIPMEGRTKSNTKDMQV